MTGDDFLLFASQLLAAGNASEAACRTAISRAYYGAFHLARAFLSDLGVRLGKDHGEIWRRLGSSGIVPAKQAATMLAVLHENRTVDDYDLNSPKPKNEAFASDNVKRAMDVRALLQMCGQEPIRTQIKTAVSGASK